MGEVEAKWEGVMRHTVSLLTDLLVFPQNRSLKKKALSKKHGFPPLKVWCPDHLWAPSCSHKTFKKSFIENVSQSVGHGWEVVERYIDRQKRYNGGVVVTVRDGIDRLRTFVLGM